MSIRTAVENISEGLGIGYLKEYYSPDRYTGAHFEALDADNNPYDLITASDLYSVSTLTLNVPARAGIAILDNLSDEISDLLSQITHDDLGSLSNKEFEEQLGQNSAALKLWNLLCRNNPGDKKWGIGPTIASKIMARKRPHLIPIHDSVVKEEIGQRRNDKVWRLWWEALTEDGYLETCAEVLRQAINRPELSTLRTLDVLLWMSGKNKKQSRNSLNSERRRVTGA